MAYLRSGTDGVLLHQPDAAGWRRGAVRRRGLAERPSRHSVRRQLSGIRGDPSSSAAADPARKTAAADRESAGDQNHGSPGHTRDIVGDGPWIEMRRAQKGRRRFTRSNLVSEFLTTERFVALSEPMIQTINRFRSVLLRGELLRSAQ